MEAEKSTRKILQTNKKLLDDLVKRRHVYFQGMEIYGGCAGFYDYGPVGCSIKTNLQQLWRDHFILQEDMLEINTSCILTHTVLQNSGHVQKFTDLMVKDIKTGQGFRADKLIAQWIDNKLNKDKKKLKPQEIANLEKAATYLDSFSQQQIDDFIKKNKIKNPDTGNELSKSEPFNLMFQTQIGPTGKQIGYLRPETAQGMFLNFSKCLDYNGGRVPFAAAQIGLGFRNQIAPRSGLIRVRQFQMAQIQHFVDPQNKNHPKFKKYAGMKLPIYSAQNQQNQQQLSWISLGEALENKIIANQTLGYFLARIYLFLEESGINVQDHLRFRQHMKSQMAHYACDCWDAEIQMSSGWVQCVGCADRSAFDLEHHASGSGQKLYASRKFKQPRPQQQTQINLQRQVVGKQFKKDSQPIIKYLEGLEQKQKASLKQKFDTDGQFQVNVNDKSFILEKKHLNFEQKIVNVSEQKFIPNVIQPSFGLGRILTAILEHSFKARDEKRTYLCLKPKMAPVKVSILPLQQQQKFQPIISEIRQKLKRKLVSCKVDDTGQSIGKRYSRTDEIGIPFALTIDYKTLQDQTITLRELHTMKQIRIPLSDVDRIVCQLALEHILWSDIHKEYPQAKSEQKE